jgi:BirA family biotin operon repressor/biotin-[acetyl-CoA-carboxylase] ligase
VTPAEAGVAARVRALLDAEGTPWPAPIEHFVQVESTNDLGRARAKDGAPAWTAVLADTQTAGRGRQGRPWTSPPGNLFLSVVLRPPAPSERWGWLPLLAGVAAAEALERFGARAELKWPNDLYARGRKLGGILVEAASGAAGLESAVVGIGVNVALRAEDLPPEWRDATTSIAMETSAAPPDVARVAAAVLARLSRWYDALAREGPASVREAWRARALPWWDRPVEARSGDRRLVGIARGIDETGALVLEMEDGTRTALHSGDVREVRRSE